MVSNCTAGAGLGAAAVPCAGDGGRAPARLAAPEAGGERGVSPRFIVVDALPRPGCAGAAGCLAAWSLPELGLRPLAPIIFRTTIAF